MSVEETTYLVVSLKNGAPGSSSTVRVDQAGSNISRRGSSEQGDSSGEDEGLTPRSTPAT